jgi:recombination protein RecA
MVMDKRQKIFETLKKDFGKESIFDPTDRPKIEWLSTTSPTVDWVCGNGFPRGRIVELYGDEGSGKSTLMLLTVGKVLREGGIAGYIDFENAVDIDYTTKLGIDFSKIILSQPDTGEQGLLIAESLIEQGADLVVIDSTAAIVTKRELEGELTKDNVAEVARLMSQVLKKLSSKVRKSNTSLIFINQIREKIGVLYGNPECTPGGRALKFYASVRLEVKRSTLLKDKSNNVFGHTMNIFGAKNKVAFPFRRVQVNLIYGKGLEETESLMGVLVNAGIVANPKQGTYILPNGESIYGVKVATEKLFSIYSLDDLSKFIGDAQIRSNEIVTEENISLEEKKYEEEEIERG